MPSRLELPADVRKHKGRWVRGCPDCGREVSHLRRNYCVHASRLCQPCKRCSNQANNPSGMHGPVRVAWFNSFYKSAISRGYDWSLTIDDLAAMYEQQQGRCVLTAWPIAWSERGWDHTASIDRIDNTKSYELENVQLVHKSVNMARGTLEVQQFVDMCRAVADRVKW